MAISYPSLVLRSVLRRVAKDRGCSGAKAPHDDAHSFDRDGVAVYFERNLKAMETQTPTSRILMTCLGSVVLALFCSAAVSSADTPLAVPTFHCISLYWNRQNGSADDTCAVRYRPAGSDTWKAALPLWFDYPQLQRQLHQQSPRPRRLRTENPPTTIRPQRLPNPPRPKPQLLMFERLNERCALEIVIPAQAGIQTRRVGNLLPKIRTRENGILVCTPPNGGLL